MSKKKSQRNNNKKKNRAAQQQANTNAAAAAAQAIERAAVATAVSLLSLPRRNDDHTLADLREGFPWSTKPRAESLEVYEKKKAAASISLHPKDDIDHLLDSFSEGKVIDSKILAKLIPHTVEDWKAGKIDIDEFILTFSGLYNSKMHLTSLSAPLKELGALAVATFADIDYIYEEFLDIFDGHVFYLVSLCPKVSKKPLSIEECLQLAVNTTCETFSSKERFLEICPVYHKPIQFFRELLEDYKAWHGAEIHTLFGDEEMLASTDLFSRHLRLATGSICSNVNFPRLKNSCWECGIVPEKYRMFCSRCNVAHYCGKTCQVKAWKDGHKEQCKHLPERYKLFQENCSVYLKAHAETSADPDEELQLFQDTMVFRKMTRHEAGTKAGTWVVKKGPSMEVYYENIKRIRCGEFWIWSQPDSMEYYMQKLAELPLNIRKKEEAQLARVIHYYLCFEFEHSETGQIARHLHDPFGSLCMNELYAKLSMPAERFLELKDIDFKNYEMDKISTACYRTTTAWHIKTSALCDFRKWAHKGERDETSAAP